MSLTFAEKCKATIRKKPSIRFKRGDFAWEYGVDHYDFNENINALSKKEFIEFFDAWESISRAYREVLKDPEFRLPEENQAKLQELNSKFRENYAKKND